MSTVIPLAFRSLNPTPKTTYKLLTSEKLLPSLSPEKVASKCFRKENLPDVSAAKRPKQETSYRMMVFVETLPTIAFPSVAVLTRIDLLAKQVLGVTQNRFPHIVVIRICMLVESLPSQFFYHEKSTKTLVGGTPTSSPLTPSFFFLKYQSSVVVSLLTGSKIGEGGQSKVTSAFTIVFRREDTDFMCTEAFEAVKHRTFFISENEVLPKNYKWPDRYMALKDLSESTNVALPYFTGLYKGKNGRQIVESFRRYTGDLKAYLETLLPEIRLPEASLNEVALQLGQAIEATHTKGIVHRDIKLGNIFANWDASGLKQIFLGDYGYCDYLNNPEFSKKDSGTFPMHPPEVIARRLDIQSYFDLLHVSHPDTLVSTALDMWAFGLILIKLSTGVDAESYTLLLNMKRQTLLIKDSKTKKKTKEKAENELFKLKQQWIELMISKIESEQKNSFTSLKNPTVAQFAYRCMAADPRLRPSLADLQIFIRHLKNIKLAKNLFN